jgi:hypothetical protein
LPPSEESVAIGANSKASANDLRDPLRFFDQLFFGNANHFLAPRAKIEVAASIVLEGRPAAVRSVSIGFDHQISPGPVEIDEVWPDPYVDLWPGYAEAPAEGQEVQLQVAATAFAPPPFVDRQAEEVRLSDRASQLARGDKRPSTGRRPPKVGDRLRRIRDRNAVSGRNCSR